MRAIPASELLILTGEHVRRLMPMGDCIPIIERTMRGVSAGQAALPTRIAARIPASRNLIATMPGYLAEPETLGSKVIAVFPENAARGLSSHMGVVVLFDPKRGVPVAIVDAASITGIRTAAATAVATRALARADAANLAIFGTGEQAEAHLVALLEIRPWKSIVVWGRSAEKARDLAERFSRQIGRQIEHRTRAQDAAADADVICTTTSSREPILCGEWVRAGTHVNLVGASLIDAREADEALVLESRFFVDYRPSTVPQAGELHAAFGGDAERAGAHIRGEIGEVLKGAVPGRTGTSEVTVYKSLGIAAQDLAVAHAVYERAREQGLGTRALV
ncbi:MAG TPA: ornithine cyclodeaminase family protein [Steroidobacteraceae bacterium]|nr:ornithine cyclodeaminase family protein [Steroidobacteraceae bacterium]